MKEKAEQTIRGGVLMLAGLGALKLAELTGVVNVKVDTMNITPAQAAIVRNDLMYDTEPSPLPRSAMRRLARDKN